MGTRRMSSLVLLTGIPLMLSLLVNSLYNFVDSMFVSRVSEDALTALSGIAGAAAGFGAGTGKCGWTQCVDFQGVRGKE